MMQTTLIFFWLSQTFLFLQRAAAPEMTTGGWIFMLGAWTAIISLAIFCFSKVLRKGKKR